MTARLKKEVVYKSFKLQKPLPRDTTRIQSVWQTCRQSYQFFKAHWLKFHILLLIFTGLVFLLLFSTEPATNLAETKAILEEGFGGRWNNVFDQLSQLSSDLINNFFDQLSQSLGILVSLILLFSTSLWWLMRQLQAGVKVKIRDALYFGPAQIVPILLLALLFFLQILPVLVIASLTAQLRQGVLDSYPEQLAALGVIICFILLSAYWITGGIFSMIIASLPGTRPYQAWQSSLHLTHRRRRLIGAYFGAGFLMWIMAATILILPVLLLLPQIADYAFYLFNLYGFTFIHLYTFFFYKSLIAVQQPNITKSK